MKKLVSIVNLIFVFVALVCLLYNSVYAGQPKQELKIAFGPDEVTFDPHNYVGTQDLIGVQPVYETLLSKDKELNIIPKLATSWKQIDPLTWEFTLRKGVKFHDGNPFNAEAVKYSIERCKVGVATSFINFVDRVEIIDDYKVRLILNKEFGEILSFLTIQSVGMMSPKFVEEKGKSITGCASGTGPFKLIEYEPANKAVYIKNEDYWGEPAKLDRIEFRNIPEEGTRVMALRSGEVDVIENPAPHELEALRKDKNLYVYTSPKGRTLFLSFMFPSENVGGAKNKPLREAIAYAINKQELVDYVLEGLADPANNGWIPDLISKGIYDPTLNREYNLDKAKKILAEAGIEPGRKIEFLVTSGRYLLDKTIGEVIQEQLSKIGLDVSIITMEFGPLINTLMEHKTEMWQLAYGWAPGCPKIPFEQLFYSKEVHNFSAWYRDEYDRLLDKANATVDFKERIMVFNQAYKLLFDDVAIIPILHYKNLYAANKKVKGFYADINEIIDFNQIYIE